MEKLDKERYLKRVIIVCWIALGICFGIKLFGGNIFEIICSNENFIKVCEYADSHLWANYLIYVAYSFALQYFFVLSMIAQIKYTKTQFIVTIITVCVNVLVKLTIPNIGLIFDLWQVVIMPAVFTIKTPKKHWNIVIGNGLLILFQVSSMFVKNINIDILTNEGVLTSTIFSIDVLLMILLYYAYVNFKRKEKE